MTKHPNTLIIGDAHLPFIHRNYLDFCVDTAKAYGCKRICNVGDITDNHSISFHEHNPDGLSSGYELAMTKRELKRWYRAFPHMDLAIGNHDELGRRQAFANGLSSSYLKSFNELYEAPRGWKWAFEWRYGNWRLTHGTGTSGHDAAFKSAVRARISTAQGHIHTAAGVKFHASNADIIWGLQVGCGINRKAYAFGYGRDFLDKPILGCGVVVEGGRIPMFVPMPM